MAVSETFFRRLIVEMKRSSRAGVTRLLDDSESGVKWVVPVDVHLEKGDKGVQVPIAATVEAAPERAFVVLKTSRPGVMVRLAQLGTDPSCRASGKLLTVADNIFDVGWNGIEVLDQYWDVGQWFSRTAWPLASVEDSNWSHEVVEHTATAAASSLRTIATWGSSYLNLGQQNDGKVIQFWVKIPFTSGGETLTTATLYLSSYPYGDAVHDDDIVGGGTDDPNVVVADANPHFSFEFYGSTRQLIEDDVWSMVTARKEVFSNQVGTEGQPLWNRITIMSIVAVYSGIVAGETMRVGSVYFGDRLEHQLDTVMIQPFLPTASVPLVLSLDGPSDGPAHVEGMVIVK